MENLNKAAALERIFDVLRFGAPGRHKTQEEPILSQTIECHLGIAGSTVRDAVRHFRRMGWPILGDDHGYRFAASMEEYDAILKDLESRCESMHGTASALRAKRVEFAEQLGSRRAAKAREVEDARGAHAVPLAERMKDEGGRMNNGKGTEWARWQAQHKPQQGKEEQETLFGGEA